jgi:uncharacterized RDD family membrane protein YckC
MKCPKCENAEFDESGICPDCGFQKEAAKILAVAEQVEPPDSGLPVQPAAPHSPRDETPEGEADMPQWRQELSRRLKEIKEKREGGAAQLLREDRMRPLPFPQSDAEKPGPQPVVGTAPKQELKRTPKGAPPGARALRRTPRPMVRPEPPAASAVPGQSAGASAPIHPGPAAAQPSIDIVFRSASIQQSAPDVRNVIDEFVTKQGITAPEEAPLFASVTAVVKEPEPDGKMILLSRTLSGLVDILVVFLWTVALIVAEDLFSGIETFDLTSIRNGVLLLAANYFLYSLFFLGTANQTIGMMITNLRLVGDSGFRPDMGRIVWRCVLFLPSLLLLGAGLAWAFVDRQSRCLHDTMSHTRVEPVAAL